MGSELKMTTTLEPLNLEEVEARGPLLMRICSDLVEVHRKYVAIVRQTQQAGRETVAGDESIFPLREQRRVIEQQLKVLDTEVQHLGGIIAEAATGTVEFLGEISGEEVMFSWQHGDSNVAFWRPINDEPGTRLPLPTEAAEDSKLLFLNEEKPSEDQ